MNARDRDPGKIKGRARGKLALWGGIDTHEVLPKGTPEDIRSEAKTKIDILGKGGGYIFSPDHNILVDVPPENLMALFDAAFEFGHY